MHELEVFTVGHGVRPTSELISALREAGRETLADVRRFPFSRRNPQFNQAPLRAAPEAEGITYRHAVELGGLRSDEPGEAEFLCIRVAAFRSYAARMRTSEWQEALATSSAPGGGSPTGSTMGPRPAAATCTPAGNWSARKLQPTRFV